MCGLETEYDLHRVLKLNNQAPIINDGLEKKKTRDQIWRILFLIRKKKGSQTFILGFILLVYLSPTFM